MDDLMFLIVAVFGLATCATLNIALLRQNRDWLIASTGLAVDTVILMAFAQKPEVALLWGFAYFVTLFIVVVGRLFPLERQ